MLDGTRGQTRMHWRHAEAVAWARLRHETEAAETAAGFH